MGKPVLLLTRSVVDPDGRTLPPLLYLREDDNLIVCNVRPPSERWNPWPLNVRAHPKVTVRIKGVAERRVAHEAGSEEIEELWPRLVALWPPYQRFFARTHERAVFVLERSRRNAHGARQRPALAAEAPRGGRPEARPSAQANLARRRSLTSDTPHPCRQVGPRGARGQSRRSSPAPIS
jgi:deazaflavin-dependent oxidoreductase (nitroreductase family)